MSSRLKTFKSSGCDHLPATETAGILEQAFELNNKVASSNRA